MNSWELGSSIRAGILKLKVAEIPGDEPERIGGTDGKVNHLSHGIGAIAQSERVSQPWFAPAGFNRGGLGRLGGRGDSRLFIIFLRPRRRRPHD